MGYHNKEELWTKEMQERYLRVMVDPFCKKSGDGLSNKIAAVVSDFQIPKEFVWTKEDWKDLYDTLKHFKNRFMQRHMKDVINGK